MLMQGGGYSTVSNSNAALMVLIARFIPELCLRIVAPRGQRGPILAHLPALRIRFPRWAGIGSLPAKDAPAGLPESWGGVRDGRSGTQRGRRAASRAA